MKSADILLVEDVSFVREVVRERLEAPYRITREAATLDEALEAIEDVAQGNLACDVVVLDGDLVDLDESSRHPFAGYAASQVVSRIRQMELPLKVIGFSANSLTELGIPVDVDVQDKNVEDLQASLTAL